MITNLTETQLLDSIKLTISYMQPDRNYLICPDYWMNVTNQLSSLGYSIINRADIKIKKTDQNQLIINEYKIKLNNFPFIFSFALPFAFAQPTERALICGYLEGLEPIRTTKINQDKKIYLDLF